MLTVDQELQSGKRAASPNNAVWEFVMIALLLAVAFNKCHLLLNIITCLIKFLVLSRRYLLLF